MFLSSTIGIALASLLADQPAMHVARSRPTVTKGGALRSGGGRYRWAPVRTTSRKARNPNNPREAAVIAAAQAKRDRRAVKLARDSAKYR